MLKEDDVGMHDLTLVGRSEDGADLILESGSGERFRVPLDEALLAAVQGSSAGGPTSAVRMEMQMDSPLRPRDIQARIRAGESPEAVAAAAGTDVERVMTFARPVLAERAHIAERAQRASVRGLSSETGTRLLGDVVETRMRSFNTSPDTVSWDAWRREDGRWALVASLSAAPESAPEGDAEFIFDTAGRYVLAENDTARWLTGEEIAPPAPVAPAQTAEPAGSAPPSERVDTEPTAPVRRLAPVAAEEELPLGTDALKLVADAPPSDTEDWMATQASERTAAEPETAEPEESDEAAVSSDSADEPEPDKPSRPEQRKSRRNRTSVPSWDEIMFGSGPTE